jgi:hypothetical protein
LYDATGVDKPPFSGFGRRIYALAMRARARAPLPVSRGGGTADVIIEALGTGIPVDLVWPVSAARAN